MSKKTWVEVAAMLLVCLVGALGYFVTTSPLLHPTGDVGWREIIILSIHFINNSPNSATSGIYYLYPEGEHGFWDCRTTGQEKGYFEMRVWNDGRGGHAYSSILVGSAEYDHWEGDLIDQESVTWRTVDFGSGSYSYPRLSSFTVRAYDTLTSPWTITDERTVVIECVSSTDKSIVSSAQL